MAATKTTRLQAVNTILSAGGETPVSSLTANAGVDSQLAEQILDEAGATVQAEGWHWNTREVTYAADAQGQIQFPENVIRVDMNDKRFSLITIRAGKAFNMATGSFTDFASGLTATVVELLEWDDLPEAARIAITKKAARMYVDRHVSDPNVVRLARQDEAESRTVLDREECAAGNYSIFSDRDSAVIDRGSPLDWLRIP